MQIHEISHDGPLNVTYKINTTSPKTSEICSGFLAQHIASIQCHILTHCKKDRLATLYITA